jgi:hypothetical protein
MFAVAKEIRASGLTGTSLTSDSRLNITREDLVRFGKASRALRFNNASLQFNGQ